MPPETALPANVIPFRRYRVSIPAAPRASMRDADAALGQELAALYNREKLLARQLERFLSTLLYHSLRKHGASRTILDDHLVERIEVLFPHTRVLRLAKVALSQRLGNDLAQLGAALVAIEMQTRSGWRKKIAHVFSPAKRQAWADLKHLAGIFAPEAQNLQTSALDRLIHALREEER